MNNNFAELEDLARQPIEFDTQVFLSKNISIYETAPLYELFNLLESAVESYTLVRDHLAAGLRESAEQEIQFFLLLLQNRLNLLLESSKLKNLQLQIHSV